MARPRHVPLLLCLALATGCSAESARPPPDPGPVTVLYPLDERVLGAMNMPAHLLLFLPLVAYGDDGELEGRLARAWEHSPDYRTWTVRLRTDVRWHDGVPVTARDIEFTLDLLSHPAVGWMPADGHAITVLDDSTYTITYHKRTLGSPLDYYTAFFPRHLLEGENPESFGAWDFWTRPVGNGPYRYVRHVPRTMVELEANPDYFRGRPAIDRVRLKFGDAAVTELLSGNVDAAYVDGPDRLRLEGDRRFRVYHSITPNRLTAVGWNVRHELFADPNVRLALTLGIDRRELHRLLHRLLHLPAETPVIDGIITHRQFRRGEIPPPLPHDPERARWLLEGADWRDTDGDGVLDRDGEPFRFTALTTPGQGLDRSAVYVQAQLRRFGIRMDIESIDFNAAAERVRAGRFEAAVYSFTPSNGYIPASVYLEALGYDDSRVAELIERGSCAPTERGEPERGTITRSFLPRTALEIPWHERVLNATAPHRLSPNEYRHTVLPR